MLFFSTDFTSDIKSPRWIILLALGVLYSCRPSAKNRPDHPGYFDRIIDTAVLVMNSASASQSVKYIDSVYNRFPAPGAGDLHQKYKFLSFYYLNYKNYSLARLFADSMLISIKGREKEYKKEYANGIFAQADVLIAEKKYTEAFRNYYNGKLFVTNNLDSCDYSLFTGRQAMLCYRQGKYREAIDYTSQTIRESSYCSENDFINSYAYPQQHMNTLGLCYEKLGKYDSAIYYYEKALGFIGKRKTAHQGNQRYMDAAKGVVLGNMGGAYCRSGNLLEGEKLLLESIRINNRKYYEIRDAHTAQMKLADMYLNTSRVKEAEKLLGEVRSGMDSMPSEQNLLKWLGLKFDFYEKKQITDSAYHYFRQYVSLKDSLNQANRDLSNADLDKELKYSVGQYNLQMMVQKNSQKNIYLMLTLVFLSMAVSIVLLIWYSWKQSKKNIQRLTMLNAQVVNQNMYMQNALNALEQSQHDNTRLKKIVAHDLRNPVAGIISFTDLLLADKNTNEENREIFQMMQASGKHAIKLIEDLLHEDAGSKGLMKKELQLDIVLRYCADLLQFRADEKQQRIILSTEPVSIMASNEKLWRVISNLISNAIKFSPENSEIRINLAKKEKSALISISDQGIGIPQHLRDKVFDAFTEARRQGTSGELPFGLGLSIARQIILAHNGKIWFESAENKGTTFYIEMPLG